MQTPRVVHDDKHHRILNVLSGQVPCPECQRCCEMSRGASQPRSAVTTFCMRPGADIERARRERSFISMQTTGSALVPQPRPERTAFVAVAPPWHCLGPILTLAGCIEDHHEIDSQRTPLCRSITSSAIC